MGSTLALVPYYFTVRQMFRPAVALGAAVLTAWTSGYWITSLRMVSDPVACLFVNGAVCARLLGLRDRRWFWCGMALCGVALGVKQTAVYFFAPFTPAVNNVMLRRHGWRRPLVGSGLFAAAVAAWLLPTVNNCHGRANYPGACRAMQAENYNGESVVFHPSAPLLSPLPARLPAEDARDPYHRGFSVQLAEIGCATDSRPLLVHREEGWYDLESDGTRRWRWTDGNAALSAFVNRQRPSC